jgi:hypothetical protein
VIIEGAARGYAKLIGEKNKYDIEGITAVDPKRDLGGRSAGGIVGANLTYDSKIGDYSFSLVNKLREPVRNVYCLIVFYDKHGIPLDVQVIRYSGVIPDGLAKRITGSVDPSVQRLNEARREGVIELLPTPPYLPGEKIEFRILDFEIVKCTCSCLWATAQA